MISAPITKGGHHHAATKAEHNDADQFEISLLGQLNPVLFSPQQQCLHKKMLKNYWSPHEKFLQYNRREEDPNVTQERFGPTGIGGELGEGDTQMNVTRSDNIGVEVTHTSQ